MRRRGWAVQETSNIGVFMLKSWQSRVTVVVLGISAACGRIDVARPLTLADQLSGTWYEPSGIPGVSNVVTLAVSDTTISGTGTYTIEAGQPGTITVNGVIVGTTVRLNMIRSN